MSPEQQSLEEWLEAPDLRGWVIRELDRIDAELPHWPTIAQALTQQLRNVVAAWPDVSIMGVPYEQWVVPGER